MRKIFSYGQKWPISGRPWPEMFLVAEWIIMYSVTRNLGRGPPPGHFRPKINKKKAKYPFLLYFGWKRSKLYLFSKKSQKRYGENRLVLIYMVLTPPNRVPIGSNFFPDQMKSFSKKLKKRGSSEISDRNFCPTRKNRAQMKRGLKRFLNKFS